MFPDPDRVLNELRQVPAFRAQEFAAGVEHVQAWVTELTRKVDDAIQKRGVLYFQEHPAEDRVPYAVFLHYDVSTKCHNFTVQVGNLEILAMERQAFARIMRGELGRNLVRVPDGGQP